MPHHRAGFATTSRRSLALTAAPLMLSLVASPAWAVTPIQTYFGPGLPLDPYFAQGVPGYQNEEGVTVLSRERPEYESSGIRVGSFVIRPELDESAGYNSNVIGTQTPRGSSLLETSAGLGFASDWSRNAVGGYVSVDNLRYFDLPNESYTNATAQFGGTIDIGRDQLTLSYSHLYLHENPTDITTFQQILRPIAFNLDDVRASYITTLNRWSFVPNVDFEAFRFGSATQTGLGFIPSSFNQNVLQGGVITRYQLSPRTSAVLVLNGDAVYFTNQPAGQANNNQTGFAGLVGVDYGLTGLIHTRLLVGYQQRYFTSPQTPSRGAPIAEGDVIWTPNGLTTVTAKLSRTIENATDQTATGYTYTRAGIVVDHEYLRNVLLQAHIRYENADFLGTNFNETLYAAGAGATWLLNRHLALALSYEYVRGQSNQSTIVTSNFLQSGTYNQNVALLQVRLGY